MGKEPLIFAAGILAGYILAQPQTKKLVGATSKQLWGYAKGALKVDEDSNSDNDDEELDEETE